MSIDRPHGNKLGGMGGDDQRDVNVLLGKSFGNVLESRKHGSANFP